MIEKTIFLLFPCGVIIILSPITSYCFFNKLIFVTVIAPEFVFACFLQPKFVIVTVSTYINSASTYMCLLFKYNMGNK